MMTRPLDDRTYCARSALLICRLRRYLYDSSLRHFTASRYVLKCRLTFDILTFSTGLNMRRRLSSSPLDVRIREERGYLGLAHSIARLRVPISSPLTLNMVYLFPFLPLDEVVASRAVFVIVSRSDGRKRFWSQLNNSKTVRDRPYVSIRS